MTVRLSNQLVVPKHARQVASSRIEEKYGGVAINSSGVPQQNDFVPFQGRFSKKTVVIVHIIIVAIIAWAAVAVSNNILEGPIIITKSNFSTVFVSMGAAINQFNPKTGVQTLTKDTDWQRGATVLTSPIDMGQDFSIALAVNLGDKDSSQYGSDGISFFFHPDSPWDFGYPGGSLAVGGVKDAFGFKLDTYFNSQADADKGAEKGMLYSADPPGFDRKSFGAFINTQGVNSRGEAEPQIKKGYSQVIFSNPLPQMIPAPSHNRFRDFSLHYSSKIRVLAVQYAGVTWRRNISTWISKSTKWYFSVAATTGGGYHNMQQIRIQRCVFTPAKIGS